MRVAFWLLGLFAVSVALALFAGNNQASITLFWPPYRVDLSLNFVILALALGFAVLHIALRALSTLISMPSEARRWRAQQRERAMYFGLIESISYYSAGRFTRARKAAVAAAERAAALRGVEGEPTHRQRVEALAHLYASESTHSLQDPARRDEHWQNAMELCRSKDMLDLREAAILRSARWLIDDRDAHGCLNRLAELPQGAARRTLALRLKLRAARLARETQLALDTARLLAKHKAFSPQASTSILRGLITDLLGSAHDLDQTSRAWKQLDDSERADPNLALLAAQKFAHLAHHGAHEEEFALDMARQCLKPVWEGYASLGEAHRRRLARAMEQAQVGLSRDWLTSIEQAQRAAGNDPLLQYIAANACADQKLWGKAMQLLQQCAPALSEQSLARRAWLAIAKLAQERQDANLEKRALDRAAQITD
jgi:HemY protein